MRHFVALENVIFEAASEPEGENGPHWNYLLGSDLVAILLRNLRIVSVVILPH